MRDKIAKQKATLEDVKAAYRKLKSIAYFDKTQSLLKTKILDFETENNNLIELTEKINQILENEENVPEVGLTLTPKNINSKNLSIENEKDVQVFIDISIEEYVISILWVMEIGIAIDQTFDETIYGNRITKDLNNQKNSPYLTRPYYEQYSNWQSDALKAANEAFEKKENIVIVNLDLKRFYYQVDFNQKHQEKILRTYPHINEDVLKKRLHKRVFKVIEKYNQELEKHHFSLKKGNQSLPLGYMPSLVLSNYYLKDFDELTRYTSPIYYGRYVDDILIVYKDIFNTGWIEESEKPETNVGRLNELYKNRHSSVTWIKNTANKEIRLEIKKQDKIKEYIFNDEKSRMLFFAYDGMTIHLENFKKHIDENSSEFRLLPEGGNSFNIAKIFNSKDLEGHKISTVLSDTINKYEFSKFISKILYVIKNTKGYDKKIIRDLENILTKENILKFHGQWETIFTVFLLAKEYEVFQRLTDKTKEAINQISYNGIKDSSEKTSCSNEEITQNLRRDLTEILLVSIARTIALASQTLVEKKLIASSLTKEEKDYLEEYRKAFFNTSMVNKNIMGIHTGFLDLKKIDKGPLCDVLTDFSNHIEYQKNLIMMEEICEEFYFLPYNLSLVDIKLGLLYSKIHKDEDFNLSGINKINHKDWFVYNGYKKEDCKDVSFDRQTQDRKIFIDHPSDYTNLSKVYVGIGNVTSETTEEEYYRNIKQGISNNTYERYKNISESLNTAIRYKKEDIKTNLFLLPEAYTPFSWLGLLVNTSKKNEMAIITGVEHIKYKNKIYNLVASIFPIKIDKYILINIGFHLKVHYAPIEIKEFGENNLVKGNQYEMYKWRGMNIVPYCCYELTSIEDRMLFKKDDVNTIVAIVYNRDVQYFSNIIESLSRDLNSFVLQANDAKYGDCRVFQPAKSHHKDLLKFKGGINHTALISVLELESLKEHLKSDLTEQSNHKKWKIAAPKTN